MTTSAGSASLRLGLCSDDWVSTAAVRHSATPPAQTRPIAAGLARTVSTLNTGRLRLDWTTAPISSRTLCIRFSRTDIDIPSGVWVQRIERQVESPTQTDFQPPLKPRWTAG